MSGVEPSNYNTMLAFLTGISLFGIVLSSSFVFFFAGFEDDFAFRNLVVGSAFIAVCVLGLVAALFPSSCSAVPRARKSNTQNGFVSNMHKESFRAHHPACENYRTHILHVGNRELCATCSGLAVGAVVAVIGACWYFFGIFSAGMPSVLVLIGAVGVALGLLQSALPEFSNGSARFFASVFFVVGAFLMLISVDESLESTFVDLFLVTLSLLWIATKIALSRRDHQRTCSQCSKFCVWRNLR